MDQNPPHHIQEQQEYCHQKEARSANVFQIGFKALPEVHATEMVMEMEINEAHKKWATLLGEDILCKTMSHYNEKLSRHVMAACMKRQKQKASRRQPKPRPPNQANACI